MLSDILSFLTGYYNNSSEEIEYYILLSDNKQDFNRIYRCMKGHHKEMIKGISLRIGKINMNSVYKLRSGKIHFLSTRNEPYTMLPIEYRKGMKVENESSFN